MELRFTSIVAAVLTSNNLTIHTLGSFLHFCDIIMAALWRNANTLKHCGNELCCIHCGKYRFTLNFFDAFPNSCRMKSICLVVVCALIVGHLAVGTTLSLLKRGGPGGGVGGGGQSE